jgi:hypothetical protein
MKYKIHYKSLDEVYNNSLIVEFMEKNGYVYSSYNGHTMHFKKDEKGRKITLTVNFVKKTILKYFFDFVTVPNKDNAITVDALFTKEELRFFDSLDYEVDSIFLNYNEIENLQDIADWVTM